MSDKTQENSSPPVEQETPPPASPTPVVKTVKKKREGVKMTDKQKTDLNKHMLKVGKNMTVSEKKSHRMKMMGKMRKGETLNKAYKSIK
jgi:hypothetical protein